MYRSENEISRPEECSAGYLKSMKILNLFADTFSKTARPILEEVGEVSYKNFSQHELDDAIGDYDAVVVTPTHTLHKGTLDRAKKLKIIISPTTGLDHIDLDYAKEKGIEVISLRGETDFLDSITGTAELAFGLLLSLLRFIPHSFDDVKNYRWDREAWRGRNLYGKTLGIVGMGRLGKWMARYAKAFNMNVVFYDPEVSRGPFSECRAVSFDTLLAQSDVVSIHVHLLPETENMFNKNVFSKMKPGASIINTSRGKIVNETDLLEALTSGQIGGYATDVLADELSFGKSGFVDYPLVEYAKKNSNVIIVPHVGGMTHESRDATDIFIAEKTKRYVFRT